MKTIVTFLAGMGVLAASASAQSPVSLTLAEAQALALENAYAVQYARLDQEKPAAT